jgi:hypothetical protein
MRRLRAERTTMMDGVTYASVAQIAIDCLTGMSRMPQEGKALLHWMRRHEPRWRSAILQGGLGDPTDRPFRDVTIVS